MVIMTAMMIVMMYDNNDDNNKNGKNDEITTIMRKKIRWLIYFVFDLVTVCQSLKNSKRIILVANIKYN